MNGTKQSSKKKLARPAKLDALLGTGTLLATSLVVCAALGPKLPLGTGE
jgi:hypothetical protein